MTDYAHGRHLKIRNTSLFAEQARMRTLAQIISDDVVYILERLEFSDDDAELLMLNEHGVQVLAGRVKSNIEELRKSLTFVLRKLPRKAD